MSLFYHKLPDQPEGKIMMKTLVALTDTAGGSLIMGVSHNRHVLGVGGTGVPLLFKQADEIGLPVPEIMERCVRARFVIYLAEQTCVEKNLPTQQVAQQVTLQAIQLLKEMEGEIRQSQSRQKGMNW